MTTLEEEATVPQFAHAVRGYDRYQVDDYILRLNEWAAGANARAVEAERRAQEHERELAALRARLEEIQREGPATADDALKAAAERSANAVLLAVRESDDLRRRADEDAARRLEEASRQAQEIVEAARRSVIGLSEEAAQERRQNRARMDALLDEARQEADEIRRQADDEAARRVQASHDEADRIVTEARVAAENIRQDSAKERQVAEDGLRKLAAERAEIVGELNRLRSAIHSLISGAQAVTPAGPDDTTVVMPTAAAEEPG